MKYTLLGVSTEGEVNIGDYVQALAASQFLPSLDGFIQRERLKAYDGENVKMIMNGWYMHNTGNWPPSNNIDPLFISFHLNSLAKNDLLGQKSIEYLKQYEPIGCRDRETARLLQSKGLDAYFSGCLTLTLGKNYRSDEKENKCYFVDPHIDRSWSIGSFLNAGLHLVTNWNNIVLIANKHQHHSTRWKNLFFTSRFVKLYKEYFTMDILVNAEYINQQSVEWTKKDNSEYDYLKDAEELIVKYSKAKWVVTSRIHCALPCLGMETPVIFTKDLFQSEASNCRMDGLEELFTIIECGKGFIKPQFEIKGKITKDSTIVNKENWKGLAKALSERAQKFIESV